MAIYVRGTCESSPSHLESRGRSLFPERMPSWVDATGSVTKCRRRAATRNDARGRRLERACMARARPEAPGYFRNGNRMEWATSIEIRILGDSLGLNSRARRRRPATGGRTLVPKGRRLMPRRQCHRWGGQRRLRTTAPRLHRPTPVCSPPVQYPGGRWHPEGLTADEAHAEPG